MTSTPAERLSTSSGPLACSQINGELVHRVGYAPDPWTWTPWEYADGGRFTGRWDDPEGNWRTLYVGASRLACLLEVLAFARRDPLLAEDLDVIAEDPEDAVEHPTASAGVVPSSWCNPRVIATGAITGCYVLPSVVGSLPTLRAQFLPLALSLGLADVDASAVRDSRPRVLTQAISRWLYTLTSSDGQDLAGVQFQSRHGDGLELWAVYERPADPPVSPRLTPMQTDALEPGDIDLVEAMKVHRLTWGA